MKQDIFEITENRQLTPTTYRMKLRGDIEDMSLPGQFINIKLKGHYLRRPISVCNVEGRDITIVYKVLGEGTLDMTHLIEGDKLDILTGLGNGYDLSRAGDRPVLIGGGVGVPPLYFLARMLLQEHDKITVILGYNSRDEIYYEREFEELGCDITVATADGSYGINGTVIDAFNILQHDAGFTHFFACGPAPMLEALYSKVYLDHGISGQLSFEERMGCGHGACMGCNVLTRSGYKRICKDGPVLSTEDGVW